MKKDIIFDKKAMEWVGEGYELGYNIWNNKYRFNGESFDEWIKRVSAGDEELSELIRNRCFLFGGRTLASRGTRNGLSYSNCYSSGYAPDSVEGMLELNKKLALTYKSSGGQGLSLSLIRPKGSPVKGGVFTSDGIVPFMEIFNQTTASISQGGCIHEDELVLTDSGYKKIKDIKIGDKAWTKKGFIEINYLFDKGIQPTYLVKTRKGYSIRTTLDHKFAFDGFNTKKLSELSVGDNINIITKNSTFNKFDHLAYFLGYYMGNGYTNSNENGGNLCMHKNQVEIKDRLVQCIEEMGFTANVVDYENAIRIFLNKDIIDYLKSNGWIKNKAKYIEIPEFVMLSDDDTKISYLAGALDSDGTIRETGIKYDTISEKYAQQLHMLMSSIGFFPTTSKCERDESRNTLFTVTDSIRVNTPKIPSIKIEQYVKPSTTKNSAYSTPYTIENACLDRKSVKRLQKISKHDNVGLHTYLESNGKFSPMIFDEIVSIELIGDCHVYDISLVEEHLFDCNGVYVSNSRKGALMMSLSVWHPEIETFISIKDGTGKITKANLSVEIDNEFMELVKNGVTEYTYINSIFGTTNTINPTDLYNKIMKRAWSSAEPGVIFTDRFRNYNLMEKHDEYKIITSNPCGK